MSRLPFELLLALRYLRPKRTFVSIITLISVLGVTLGVAVLIIVISVMSGFDRDLRDKVLGFNAHMKVLQVDPQTGGHVLLANSAAVIQKLTALPEVRAATPFAVGQVMVQSQPDPPAQAQIAAPMLRGVDPRTETNVSRFATNLVAGTFNLSDHGLLVGVDLANHNRLGLHVGDHVAIASPPELERLLKSHKAGKDEAFLPKDFTVRGIFDSGFYDFNANIVIASLEDFEELHGLTNAVQGLMVMLRDPERAKAAKAQVQTALGARYQVTIWSEEHNATMDAVMVEKNVMLYILFFIVIVAAFGITCTLITFVVLKTREIGVLKALGATSRQIAWVFLSQSMGVSVLGILVGLTTGILGVTYRNPFLRFMRSATGLELFPSSVYEFYELPALIIPGDIAIICGGSLIICLLAAAFPVWNASRLKPVEALRRE